MAAIDRPEFAAACVRKAQFAGVLPEYLAAVAQVRSGIDDALKGAAFGPFGFTQPQWDAAIKDPDLQEFDSDSIKDWPEQVSVFAVMTDKTQAALRQKLGRDFNQVELYCEQFPGSDPNTVTNDLKDALAAVAQIIKDAKQNQGELNTDPTQTVSGGVSVKPTQTGNLFNEKAPGVMAKLMNDFGFTKVQAAAILGNIGVESAGFTQFHELGQPAEKGGIGWVQWTGKPGRRADFEAFCAAKGLDPKSDDASYGFMKHEMTETSEKKVVLPLKAETTIEGAVHTFMTIYERPGKPNEGTRIQMALTALAAFESATSTG